MDLFYITDGLASTVRGAAVLKALGYGRLVTRFREICWREGVDYWGSVPANGDVFVWDWKGELPPKTGAHFIPERGGIHIAIGQERDVDLSISLDIPIVPRQLSELDMYEAEAWWAHPVQQMQAGHGIMFEFPVEPESRVLMTDWRRARDFARDPLIRAVGPGFNLYWPAMELMPLAETVIGGEQTAGEMAVIREEADPDGAQLAAAAIQRLIERNR